MFFIYLEFGILFLLGPFFFYIIKISMNLADPLTLNFSLLLLFLYFLAIWQILFLTLADYYLDTWIITDHRVLDIQQLGLFRRDVSELRLSKIQDVNVKVKGLFPTFFNYGDVIIQTAGAVPEFKFKQIPNPYKVKDKILHLFDDFTKKHIGDVEVHEKGIGNSSSL